MSQTYSACIRKDGTWWYGWVEEIQGVLSQGKTRRELFSNLQSALSEALEMNRERALAAMEGSDYEEVQIEVGTPA